MINSTSGCPVVSQFPVVSRRWSSWLALCLLTRNATSLSHVRLWCLFCTDPPSHPPALLSVSSWFQALEFLAVLSILTPPSFPASSWFQMMFLAVLSILTPPSFPACSWFQALEATRWLSHMSALLRAAVSVVRYMDDQGRPVLVHCSDGWDRTPQITALAQIMMDPHCRTIDVSGAAETTVARRGGTGWRRRGGGGGL